MSSTIMKRIFPGSVVVWLVGLVSGLLLVTGCTDGSGGFVIAPTPLPPSGPVVVTDLILSPGNEVPPVQVASEATGFATVRLNLGANELSVEGAFAGLTSPLIELGDLDPDNFLPSSAHLHLAQPEAGQSFSEATGPIVFGLAVINNNTIARTVDLTPEQVDSFLAGAFYINIHTEANPAGELRAQIEFPL